MPDDADATAADRVAVEAVNRRFYESFEARDFDTMSDLWEHSDRVVCTHPGWSTLRGWGSVAAGWVGLLQNSERLQFILTNVSVGIEGDAAWVTVDENILDGSTSSTVAAVNVFVRAAVPGGWQIVGHHASLVHASLGRMRG
jgi:ketosteroid isomerase-like protein